MNSLKAFFTRVTDSCINPSSYRELKDKDIGTGMWYLYRLFVLTSLVTVLWFGAAFMQVLPKMRAVVVEIESKLPTLYPKELILKFHSGSLVTNVREPYTIHMPKEWVALFQNKDEPAVNLAVINTKATPDNYADSNALLLLTKKSFVAGKDNGELRVFSYDSLGNITVTQKKYQDFIAGALTTMHGFLPVLKGIVLSLFVLAPFLGALIALLGWMFMLLFYSLILFFFVTVTKRGLKFWQIYRLGLFGVTPIAIIGMLLWLVGIVQWFASIFFLLWMWFVIRSITSKSVQK